MSQYRVEFLPKDLQVSNKTQIAAVEKLITDRINRWAEQGWELSQIAQIAVTQTPGCFAGLFGAKETTMEYNCLVFKAG